MSGIQQTEFPGVCSVHGSVLASAEEPRRDPVIDRTRATWTAGDFGRIAVGYHAGAVDFIERLELSPGEMVLDVACGTGNLSIPAARRGAIVTGVDIAPNLVDAARRASADAALDIRFDVGAAESLPYADGTFDTVVSMFGVMFSARPDAALAELVRVTKSGGRIALANWVPDGFIGSMLRAHTALVPPPQATPSPLAWGDEAAMRQRLAAFGSAIRRVEFAPRTIQFAFPLSPAGVVELFRECYGPSVRAFAALDPAGRARLAAELTRLWAMQTGAAAGSTTVSAEYLEVRIVVA